VILVKKNNNTFKNSQAIIRNLRNKDENNEILEEKIIILLGLFSFIQVDV
jgi:hypothetical protein